MDKKTKKRILKEVEKEIKKAKSLPKSDIEFTLKSGNDYPLSKVIKTQAQADRFMKMLRALPPS